MTKLGQKREKVKEKEIQTMADDVRLEKKQQLQRHYQWQQKSYGVKTEKEEQEKQKEQKKNMT